MASDGGRRFRRAGAGLVVAFALGLPCVAHAQSGAADRETARALMSEGDAQFEAKEYGRALQAYRGAHALMQVPTTGIAVTRTLLKMGRLVEARDMAMQVARIPVTPGEHPVFEKARNDATTTAKELEPRIPSVQVQLTGEPYRSFVKIEVDGQELPKAAALLPRKLNPGRHTITVSGPRLERVTQDVTIAEGETKVVTMELRARGATAPVAPVAAPPAEPFLPPPAPVGPEPEPQPAAIDAGTGGGMSSLVYIGFGVGAVGVLAGSVTGFMAKSKTSDLDSQCPNSVCPPSTHRDFDSAQQMATIANISFGVGLVGIGLGVYGLMSSGSASEPESPARAESWTWQPVVGPGMTGVRGRF